MPINLPEKLRKEVFSKPDMDYRGAYGGRGGGKCLGKGTPVMMADGSIRPVEDISQGDLLAGPDGAVRTVLSISRGRSPLYRVTQKGGMSYVCNDAHLLVFERSKASSSDRGSISKVGRYQRPEGRYARYVNGRFSIIRADEYAMKSERFKCHHFGVRRAFLGETKDLPIDPYLLGLWLGDGTSSAPSITNVDPEIDLYMKTICAQKGWKLNVIRAVDKAPVYYLGSRYRRDGFKSMLRATNVLNNKHIPEVYFGASLAKRKHLLAGLVDTDGHVRRGCIFISQSRKKLAQSIQRLAHGLGYKASLARKQATFNGKKFEAWNVTIGGDIDDLPVLIARKREARITHKNKDWRRMRVDVEPIGVGDYYGFELDGDHLFLLGDGTVSHNTYSFAIMAALRALDWSRGGGEGAMVCARQVQDSLKTSSFAEVARAIRATPEIREEFDIGREYIRTKDLRVDFQFVGLEHNVDSVKSTSRIIVLWVDEAEPVSANSWTIADATVRENGSETWVTWNPESEASPTHLRYRVNPPERSAIACINWRDNPWFSERSNRLRKYDLKHFPDDYSWKWEGEFRKITEGAYFARDLIKCRAEGRIGFVAKDPMMRPFSFWDIGGTGRNANARTIWIAQFIGSELRVLDYRETVGQALSEDVKWLQKSGYGDCHCVLPHDGQQHDKIARVTYESLLREAGFTAETIKNAGKGAKQMRIESARRAFPSIRFNEKTTQGGIKALEFYHEKIDKHRHIGLGPEHDWSSDACFVGDTEILTRYGTCQIMNLPETGEVLTPCGWKRYENVRMTRKNARLVEVGFSDGHTVKCTPDHLFMTASGWKSAQSLKKGSVILSTLTNSPNTSTANSTGYGPTIRTSRVVEGQSIATFGRMLSEKSLSIVTSTIETATSWITGLRTWSALTPASTLVRTCEAGRSRRAVGLAQPRETRLHSGTLRRKVACGTNVMLSGQKDGRNGSESRSLVRIAVERMMRLFASLAMRRNTAAKRVRCKPTASGGSRTNGHVLIDYVKPLKERADVYDLTVPSEHCFSLANGAVVHNCDGFGLMCVYYFLEQDKVELDMSLLNAYEVDY